MENSFMSDNSVRLLNNPYGQFSFDTFRNDEQAFADKSLVIKFLDDKSMSKYPVLLRPRRFGKSTFVQMLKCFYDISYKDRYEELFSGTKIYQENLPSHNTYHVVNFDFSKVYSKNEDALLRSFCAALISGIENFKRRYPDFSFDYDEINQSEPVTLFSLFITAYSKYAGSKKLYIMIDEYDNFANELLSKNLDLFLSITSENGFLKTFYSTIKAETSETIAKTFITGVSSVSLDSLTSGFNIARNVTDKACFNEYAGFTENDLEILIPQLVDIDQLGVSTTEIISRMKPVYDGYCFSRMADRTVYNSSMCLYYLDEMRLAKTFLDPEIYLDPACDQDGSKLSQLFLLAKKETVDIVIDTYLQSGLFYLEKLSENINLNQVREYSQEQIISMLYYLGYLTINKEKSSPSELALMIPNRFMSKLFAKCTIEFRFKDNSAFTSPKLDLTSLISVEDNISTFADSCTDFLSGIMNNQVLSHMNEMALNLSLYAKLDSLANSQFSVKMQSSLQIPRKGEKFADLVITVNRGMSNECIYLIELKYLTKSELSEKSHKTTLQRLIKDASEQVVEYKTAIEFKDKNVKAFVMIFAGPDCIYSEIQK